MKITNTNTKKLIDDNSGGTGGLLSKWDVSRVTQISLMFHGATKFNRMGYFECYQYIFYV